MSIHVLIVDDEPKVADRLVRALKKRGYNARAAYSGIDAVSSAAMLKPQVLISDVMEPPMSGMFLARLFSNEIAGCKVLLMSESHKAETNARELILTGECHGVIAKPVSSKAILSFVANCACGSATVEE